MAGKIPRIDPGSRPSGVPQGRLTLGDPGFGFKAVSGLTRQAAEGLAAEAEVEAKKIRATREKRQDLYDESAVNLTLGAFDNKLRDEGQAIQEKNKPNQAMEEFFSRAWEMVQDEIDEAENPTQALMLAQQAPAVVRRHLNLMSTWSEQRKTQSIKVNLSAQMRGVAAGAEQVPTVEGLEIYLKDARAQHMPSLVRVYGNQASNEFDKMMLEAVDGFLRYQGAHNPQMVLDELKNPSDLVKQYTKSTQRDSLRTKTMLSYEKRHETRKYDLLSAATGDIAEAVERLNSGMLTEETGAEYLIALEKTTRAKREPIIADKSLSAAQKNEQLAIIDKELEILDAVDEIFRRGLKVDPERMFAEDAAMLAEIDSNLVKFKKKREQLPMIAEQIERLVLARRKMAISGAAYATGMKHVGRALSKAIRDEANNTGILYDNPREAGNREMNRLLKNQKIQNLPQVQRNKAWIDYMNRYLTATEGGQEISKEDSAKLARLAVTFTTDVNVLQPGDMK